MDNVVYRCGWCGHPTSWDGEPLDSAGDEWKRVVQIIESMKDSTTIKVNGKCCPNGDR